MIIYRYMTREVLQSFSGVLVVLLLIFIGRYFALYLSEASTGKITSNIVLELLLLQILTSLAVIVPLAIFIAVLLAFGRLYKDNEMTALQACGAGPGGILLIIGAIGLAGGVLVALLSFWAAPWANEVALQVRERSQSGSEIAVVAAGQFNNINGKSKSGDVFYVEDISEDRTRLKDVFIRVMRDGRLDVYSARSGYQQIDPRTGERFLVLEHGFRYQGMPGESDYRIHQYEKQAIRLAERAIEPLRRRGTAAPTASLWNSNRLADKAELQWRFSMPLATLLLPVLGVLLSRTSPRQGRFAKLFIAIVAFVTYYNMLGVAMSWVERGVIDSALGLWLIHAAVIVLLAILAVRHLGGWRFLFAAGGHAPRPA